MIGDDSIFFSDFSLVVYNRKSNTTFKGILKSATAESTAGGYVIEGCGLVLVCATKDTTDIELHDLLTIENKDYQIINHNQDGTGISYLWLEKADAELTS